MDENTLKSGRQIITFGILMAINFPLYLIIWYFVTPQNYDNAIFRILATLLCFGLIFKNYWPDKIKRLLPLYWYFVVLFTLPFFFTFMTLKNHAATLWLMNLMSALFFVILLFDLISAVIILISGALLGSLMYISTTSDFVVNAGSITISGIFFTFIAAIIIGGLFSRNRQLIEHEKLQIMKLLSFSIAHELRTPLGSVRNNISSIEKFLPAFIDGYEQAKNAELKVQSIPKVAVEHLKTVVKSIYSQINTVFIIIDMLLMNIKEGKFTKENSTILSILELTNDAISTYPMDNKQKQRIHIDITEDFSFKGNKDLFIHLIYNLLKNALYYIAAANKGEIYITTQSDNKYNALHFKDTGKGIPKEILPYIFDKFFTKTYHGAGIGLAFCKMVMKSFGGDIRCITIEDEYAEFIMTFPKID